MTEDLLATFGVYGSSFVVAFIAGMFPPFSIEVFLVGLTAATGPTFAALIACCAIAAFGHQVAKTLCYYAGVGALERGSLKQKVDAIRPKIERWNRAPKLIMFFAAAVGIPPLYVLTFIARPIMGMSFWVFTVIVFATRLGRFVALAVIPLAF